MRRVKVKFHLLYNKTRHSYIYIYIFFYSLPNSWTEWAQMFCGQWWLGGVLGKKNMMLIEYYPDPLPELLCSLAMN